MQREKLRGEIAGGHVIHCANLDDPFAIMQSVYLDNLDLV